jgi:hypothetical protein
MMALKAKLAVLALALVGCMAGASITANEAQAATYPYPLALGGTVGPCQKVGSYFYCEWYSTYRSSNWYAMAYGVNNYYSGVHLGTYTCWYYRSGSRWYYHHCSRGWGTW